MLTKSLFAAAFLSILVADGAAQEPPRPTGGPTMLSRTVSPEGLAEQRDARFAALLDQAAARADFVGFAVAIVRGRNVALLKTYGVTEAGGAAPVTPDTRFRIASLSKGFAATLVGMAATDGLVTLDAPIAGYAPRFALKNGAQAQATLAHILSHRVGLPPNAYDNLLEEGAAVDDILPRYKTVAPICRVGSCYAYQNLAYNLSGDVLSSVYGAPYEEVVRTRLFEPLGMRGASFGREALQTSGDWARPHARDRIPGDTPSYTPWRVVEVRDAYYRTPAAGGVNASINDMARWLAAQMGAFPETVPDAALELIHAPQVETPAETRRWRALAPRIGATQYGLGWRIYDYAGETLVTHSGSVEGYGAQIAMLPDQGVGIVILANTRAERVWRIIPTFLDIELGLDDADWLKLADPIGGDLSLESISDGD